jgi:hypothetical protein
MARSPRRFAREPGLVVADVADRHAREVRQQFGVTVSGPRVSPASTTRLVVTSVSHATRA